MTGGAGFIGSHVAEHFSSKHDTIIVCDNLSRQQTLETKIGDQFFNWHYLESKYPRIEMHRIDLRDFNALRRIAGDARIIVHTAAQVAVSSSLKDPRTDFETNVAGTLNVLEVARLTDSAVVFCSTNKVYGENVNVLPIVETRTRYRYDRAHAYGIGEGFSLDQTGHTPYGSSKLSADIYVQDYAHTYGLKTGVFRMSCIYGERQFGVEDQGWLAWFIIASLIRKPITIFGNGKQVRDVLYVKDLVDAFDRFLRSKLKHGVFNMGGGPRNTLSLLELLEELRKLTGTYPQISFSAWRSADQKVYISDIRKAQEQLGWKPTISPLEGVKRVLRWARQNKKLFDG